MMCVCVHFSILLFPTCRTGLECVWILYIRTHTPMTKRVYFSDIGSLSLFCALDGGGGKPVVPPRHFAEAPLAARSAARRQQPRPVSRPFTTIPPIAIYSAFYTAVSADTAAR